MELFEKKERNFFQFEYQSHEYVERYLMVGNHEFQKNHHYYVNHDQYLENLEKEHQLLEQHLVMKNDEFHGTFVDHYIILSYMESLFLQELDDFHLGN